MEENNLQRHSKIPQPPHGSSRGFPDKMWKHSKSLEIVSLGFSCQSLLGPKQYFPAVAFVLLTMEAAGVDVG